jgi:transposase
MDTVGRKKRRIREKKMSFREYGNRLLQLPPVPIIAAGNLLDRIGFKDMIDNAIKWDRSQWNVCPGDLAKAVVMSMFADRNRLALVNIGGSFKGFPLEMMFDEIRSHTEIGRDALAEMLDRIQAAGPPKVFASVSSAVTAHWGIVTNVIHSDTTSVSVEGAYAEDDPELNITYGYSKDLRPDLRQYMTGYAVGDHGLLVHAEALNGNTSDHEWNRRCLESMREFLKDGGAVYCADSKLMTMPLVRDMHGRGIRFVSRCPYNFGGTLESSVLERVNIEEMENIGTSAAVKTAAARKIQEFSETVDGIPIRVIAVKSSDLDGSGDKAVERERKVAEGHLSKFVTGYACKKDAEKAFARLSKKMDKTIFSVNAVFSSEIIETRRRGRPRKDGKDVMRKEEWNVSVTIIPDMHKEKMVRRSAEMYVIVSNVPSAEDDADKGMSSKEIVDLYSMQWKVEGAFRTLKTPALADGLFLKTQSRAEALVMLINIAVLFRGLVQMLIRKGLESIRDHELPRYGHDRGRLQRNVTTDFFIRSNQSCLLVTEPESGEYWFGDPDDESALRAKFFFGLLGIEVGNLFG